MNFDEYQKDSRKTAIYPKIGAGIVYPTLGLADEAGEVVGKVKKMFRDDGGVLTDARKEDIKKELGDVLWYLAQIATELGVSLDGVALANLEKLASRLARGKIHGNGDER